MYDLQDIEARRADLAKQLELMENHIADPQRSPSFGTLSNSEPTTDQSIARVKKEIAEIETLIADMKSKLA